MRFEAMMINRQLKVNFSPFIFSHRESRTEKLRERIEAFHPIQARS